MFAFGFDFLIDCFLFCKGFLPSSYAMVWLGFSLAMWLQNREFFAIFGIVVAAFIGWPFAALVGVHHSLHFSSLYHFFM
jgi:hypothetical protein